ncbi:DUF6261 family protein [Pedobacter sp.]|uniref:DUF6261 family protein n=1 Tax=Pedobacter sp. TaxID=1411316 RepID=UPI0031D40C96
MINNIALQPLRNSEYIQFLTDTLSIVLGNNPETLMVKTQYDALRNKTDEIEKLFKINQGSLVTKEIEVLDTRRDKAINGATLVIQGLTYSTDLAVSNHAKTLEAHLNLFGTGIARENYQSETTLLRNIINDWKTKPELQQAITALQLTTWQTEIEQANHEFSEAYSKRNDELAAAPTEKLKALRLEGNEAYYKLRNRLNSFLDINEGAEPWAGTVNKLNQNINNYLALLNRRSAGGDHGQEELPLE